MNKVISILSEIRPEFNFEESQDFISEGLLDSFDMISLVADLDRTFSISIDGEDIIPENFRNLKTIADLLAKKGILLS